MAGRPDRSTPRTAGTPVPTSSSGWESRPLRLLDAQAKQAGQAVDRVADEMQHRALATVDEDAVGGVGRVPGWTPGVRRAGEHLVGEVVGEVQLRDRLVVTEPAR